MVETDEYSFARHYLVPGEAILWRGRPGKGHVITLQDVSTILIGLFWCAMSVFWAWFCLDMDAPLPVTLCVIPLSGLSLHLIFGQCLRTVIRRRRSLYIITTKKIIRAQGDRIDLLDGRALPPMRTVTFRDGSGTIEFGEADHRDNDAGKNRLRPNPNAFCLENVPDVARVQQYIDMMER